MNRGLFQDRMRRGDGERVPHSPREMSMPPPLGKSFAEGNHLGLGQRDFNSVGLTSELCVLHEIEELDSGISEEAEIIHQREDADENEER